MLKLGRSSTFWPVWSYVGRWPRKTIGKLFHTPRNYLCHFRRDWVIVRKNSNRRQIVDFFTRVTLKFDGWHWKITGHLFYDPWSFVCHFAAICKIQTIVTVRNCPNWGKLYVYRCDLDIPPLISTFLYAHHLCHWLSLVNILWWYDDRDIMKRCDGWTDRRTDGRTGPFIRLLSRS